MIHHTFTDKFNSLVPTEIKSKNLNPCLWMIYTQESSTEYAWLGMDIFQDEWRGDEQRSYQQFVILKKIARAIRPLLIELRTNWYELDDLLTVYRYCHQKPESLKRHLYLATWREFQIQKTTQYLINLAESDMIWLINADDYNWMELASGYMPASQETWRKQFDEDPSLIQLLDPDHQDNYVKTQILENYPEYASWLST